MPAPWFASDFDDSGSTSSLRRFFCTFWTFGCYKLDCFIGGRKEGYPFNDRRSFVIFGVGQGGQVALIAFLFLKALSEPILYHSRFRYLSGFPFPAGKLLCRPSQSLKFHHIRGGPTADCNPLYGSRFARRLNADINCPRIWPRKRRTSFKVCTAFLPLP